MVAVPAVPSKLDLPAPLLATLVVVMVWSEVLRLAMMETPLAVMVALPAVPLNLDGDVLPLEVVAQLFVVTESVLALRLVMMETPPAVMDAALLALWKLDGSALSELRAVLTAVTELSLDPNK